MLRTETLEKLAELTSFKMALQVARLDAVICTRKVKNRHISNKGLFLNEAIERLHHVGVTMMTWNIHQACSYFDNFSPTFAAAMNDPVPNLAARITEFTGLITTTEVFLKAINGHNKDQIQIYMHKDSPFASLQNYEDKESKPVARELLNELLRTFIIMPHPFNGNSAVKRWTLV